MRSTHTFGCRCRESRGIAVTECAIALPLLMVLVLGVLEIGTALRASTILQSACRESGRLVALDWRHVVADGQTPNDKVIQDLKNFVAASGLKVENLTVTLTHADGPYTGQPFDVSDEDNDLQFVRIEVSLPYDDISGFPLRILRGKTLKAFIVMRATFSGGSLTG